MVENLRTMTKKARRSHKKSRAGCKECKKQHSKCDESQPSCINCATADRHCSYLDDLPQRPGLAPDPAPAPTPASASASASSPAISTPSTGFAWTPASSREAGSTPTCAGDEQQNAREALRLPSSSLPSFTHELEFSIGHLVLLHHLETDIVQAPPCNTEALLPGMKFAVQIAAEHPYLLNQLLAISALHLSLLQTAPAERAHYHGEAMRLQLRALEQFKLTQGQVDQRSCIAMSLFSGSLGFHVLCDTMVCGKGDFAGFLEKFINYLFLSQGTRAVVAGAWGPLLQGPAGALLEAMKAGLLEPREDKAGVGVECDELLRLLDSADLTPSSGEACREATTLLKQMFRVVYDGQGQTTSESLHATIAWCTIIPAEYVKALGQRRPEALVVLAYWAMLVHQSRDFWAFGDGGRFLIESIRSHLGGYWEDWLVWPLRAIDGTWDWN